MRGWLLAACCTLLVFAAANAVLSCLVMLHWRRRRAAFMSRSATELLLYRCLPAALSAALAWLTVLPAFLLHEPWDRAEAISLPLVIGGSLGLLILAAAAVRGAAAIWRTRRAVRGWLGSGAPARVPGWPGAAWLIEPGSPGVCVVGFRQPVLLVSRRVVEACTRGELSGVVAHERAHTASRDNWKSLVLRSMPDVIGMTPVARRIECVWRARAEEEADATAVRIDGSLGVEIAGALVKLARRDDGSALALTSSFGAGGPIERRVRRLLAGRPPAYAAGLPSRALVYAALAAAVALGVLPPFSRGIHAVTETLVQMLT